ncbi:MAG: MBL fold metallo-hydrolase [Propionibacteriaceae bacterium]|nr:MBL fold metallo-hydrolase [Propionibacteriaceae bacterium]
MDIELIELPQLTIRRIAVSGMDNNAYLLSRAGEHLLIDAAAEPDALAGLLAVAGPGLRHVLTTHSHRDHIGALAAVAAAHPEAQTLAGAADAAAITAATGVAITRRLSHGDVIGLGGLELAVIGLRGHTPGSVALAHSEPGAPPQLFTGDSLFPGGVGNTGGDPGRFADLFTDVVARVFDVYPDDSVVRPGHGAPTTLGAERPHLAEWLARGW